MKKRLFVGVMRVLVSVFVLFAFTGGAFAAQKLTKIAEGVYASVDVKNGGPKNSYGANGGIIIGKDGIVVVDTMISAKEAKDFIRKIRAVSRKPIKYVINTHYHLDHVLGNSEFVKLGAVVIAQENAGKAMKKSAVETLKNAGSYGLTQKDMEGTVPAYPVLAYGDKMTIDMGDQYIELIHTRHAHTDGDTLVYLPAKKVLFTGDILFTKYHPFLGEGNIEEWAAVLDEIKAMGTDKIIPGHGPVSGKQDLDDMKNYIITFDQKAKELASQSDDVEKIVTEIRKMLPERPEGAGLIAGNIRMKYLRKR